MFDPQLTAARWYFGELAHADLPSIAIEALEQGRDWCDAAPIGRACEAHIKGQSELKRLMVHFENWE
jgi:hypothetical protein